jgi:pilus assembly protein Flp/PilA
MIGFIKTLAASRRGGTAVEYGLIIAMIVLAMISALTSVAHVTTSMWNNVSEKVLSAH